jgi:triacylglycerol esterase/lipase EstA (alpha/beta hydrolase family)
MKRFAPQVRRLKRRVKHLSGYLQLDQQANEVVRRTDFAHCPRPVLLLTGFFSTRRMLEILEHRLRRDGYGVWSIRMGGLTDRFDTRSIEQSAERVREKVERLYARYDMGPLTIIGHSKGGLIGRYYVKRLGGDQRVRQLVTLGTPHHGTPLAYLGCAVLGWSSKSMWQLTPMSPFIRELKVGAFPRGVRLTSIYSKADGLAPFPTAMLETEGADNLHNIEVPGVRHGELLSHRAVYDVIRRELALGYGDEAPRMEPRAIPLHPSRP